MYDKELRKANLEKDINEIDELLNATFFDRLKAENIIVKHNTTDETVAAINSPLSPHCPVGSWKSGMMNFIK